MCNIKLVTWSLLVEIILLASGSEFPGGDENEILFKINWPGKIPTDFLESQTNVEPYIITTANNEKYQCMIPDTKKQENKYEDKFRGADPMPFLEPLFDQRSCTFRLESYWTYEICHGRYARQYHEEREGKKVKIQEYYLGTFDRDKFKAERQEKWQNTYTPDGPPIKKIDGVQMPYAEVEMTDGTICDLNNKPRKIKLFYICYGLGKHEILSLEETSSCEYEAVILSPLLCVHPDYRPRIAGENDINCSPLGNAPKKPRSLHALEIESFKFKHQKLTDETPQKVRTIFRINREGQDGEARVRVEIHPVDILDKHNIDEPGNALLDRVVGTSDLTPVQNFLSGETCLHGGIGWWKYEFCYGRSVVQYHVERDGTKTIVDLGKFDKEKHLAWIEAHPNRRPKPLPERTQLWHFYSDGSVCEKTGKLRQTEVRLKCVETEMRLFLLEPKTCEYILGVESPLICEILEHADENGLVIENAPLLLSSFVELESPISKTTKKDDDLDERIANDDE